MRGHKEHELSGFSLLLNPRSPESVCFLSSVFVFSLTGKAIFVQPSVCNAVSSKTELVALIK